MTASRIGRALVAALVGIALLSATLLAADPATSAAEDPALQQALEPFFAVLFYLREYGHRSVPLEDLVDGAVRGLVAASGDPYAAYMTPEDLESFSIGIEGDYSGVGMQVEQCGDYVCVVSPYPGSPAERAGIKPGDRILRVDGVDVMGMPVEAVAARVRGPEGTAVVLTIQRGNAPAFEVRIVRARIRLSMVDARMMGDIGYIRIQQFSSGVAELVATAHDRLVRAGARGIVLDLRNNPGGLLDEAVDVARVFVGEGPIVHIVSRAFGETTYSAMPHPPGPPVAVLVNGGSASASEIVAAAIRQNGLGILVGERTFGKGTVQQLVDVGEGRALKLTTAEYLPPDRRPIEGKGLQPDIVVRPADPSAAVAGMAPLTGRWVLERGQRGLEVLGLQQRLRLLGFAGVPEDGVFGASTAEAVRRFQAQRGLKASGRYDQATHRALEAALKDLAARAPDVQLEAAIKALREGRR